MRKYLYVAVFVSLLFMFSDASYGFGGGRGGGGGKGGGRPTTPEYYTFEDLKTASQNYKDSFYFDNFAKPWEAVANLPSQAPDGGSFWYTSARIKSIKAKGGYSFLIFPWNNQNIIDGDIVFIRGGDTVSFVVRFFSTWTHTAMVYDKLKGESFESQNDKGVNVYNYTRAWPKIVAYSVKRVTNISSSKWTVRDAYTKYGGKINYFPKAVEATKGLSHFFRKWSDKYDMDSMYCAKLVWRAFKNKGVDLDSERTSSRTFGQRSRNDYGGENPNAWIGVSPDDIYYSTKLGRDIVIGGQNQLNEPLSDSIF